MLVTGLAGCSENRNGSVDVRLEATELVDGLDVGLDEEVCTEDISEMHI